MPDPNVPNPSPDTPPGGAPPAPVPSPGSPPGGGSPPAPAPDPEIAALKAKLAAYEAQDKSAMKAAHEAELEKLRTREAETRKSAEKTLGIARKRAALSHLAGLKRAEQFFPLVADKVALDDAGDLTAEAKTALDAWRAENPELFDATAAGAGSHPMPGGRPADPGLNDPDVLKGLARLGIDPGKATDHKNWGAAMSLLGRR